ncbi:hypothetical protein JB92DRAFT_1739329 [Gautieria morchelliformis]|nr:hypothetical protein JB92DRAFT_1739329 [Gautieria morchelliformis]
MLLSPLLGPLLPQLVTSGTVPKNSSLVPRFSPQRIFQNADPSCTSLIGSCMDQITTANINNSWSIRSCVAAATCYGSGNLIGAICCQTRLCPHLTDESSLDYVDVYAPIVGSCAFSYFPCSSSSIVMALWSSIVSWTGFCGPTGTNGQPITFIPFNSNPVPPSGALTETFVAPGTTVIFSVPTVLTTVTFGTLTTTVVQTVSGVPTTVTSPTTVTTTDVLAVTVNQAVRWSVWSQRRSLNSLPLSIRTRCRHRAHPA